MTTQVDDDEDEGGQHKQVKYPCSPGPIKEKDYDEDDRSQRRRSVIIVSDNASITLETRVKNYQSFGTPQLPSHLAYRWASQPTLSDGPLRLPSSERRRSLPPEFKQRHKLNLTKSDASRSYFINEAWKKENNVFRGGAGKVSEQRPSLHGVYSSMTGRHSLTPSFAVEQEEYPPRCPLRSASPLVAAASM